MQCPTCKDQPLLPTKLEEQLPANGCRQCQGALLPLLTYRQWAETYSAKTSPPVCEISEETDAADNGNAIVCPKCSGFMTKFRINNDTDNRVDLCGSCDEAWLDSGEWQLLKQLEMQHKLNNIFTEEWQRRVRQDQTREHFRSEYEQLFGEDYNHLQEFRLWLEDHPKKASMLRYLNNSDPYQA